MAAKRVRKQVYDLRPQDFAECAVWEFALDEEGATGQDEATVRPWRGRGTLDPDIGMFVVRATFRLADGSRHVGYLTPPVQGDASLGTLQPTLLTKQGQVGFWLGFVEGGPRRRKQALYSLLGRTAGTVFPCAFASDVAMKCGTVEGTLKGFHHLPSLEAAQGVEAP